MYAIVFVFGQVFFFVMSILYVFENYKNTQKQNNIQQDPKGLLPLQGHWGQNGGDWGGRMEALRIFYLWAGIPPAVRPQLLLSSLI